MTHPDTLIPRAVEPEWGPQQAYAEGRSAYENSMLPNTTSAVRFNELSSSEQAFWVAHAAFRAALQPQAAEPSQYGSPELQSLILAKLAEKAAAKPVTNYEAIVDQYIADYEMNGEDANGVDCTYMPNENEQALLKDAFMGFDFTQLTTPPATQVAPAPLPESAYCWNCGEPDPGCGGLFKKDGSACKFHGKVKP